MTSPVISGIGESRFARSLAAPFAEYQIGAIASALDDANVKPDEVDGLFTVAPVMLELLPPDSVKAALRFSNLSEVAYAPGPTGLGLAVSMAANSVAEGRNEVAVVYFGVNWGSSAEAYSYHGRYLEKLVWEYPFGFFGQPTYFAMMAKRYMHDHDLTADELAETLSIIALEQRAAALKNSNAQKTQPLSKTDYLTGRMISDPLRVHDCCLLSDGAGALVITTLERARDSGRNRHAAVLGHAYRTSVDGTDANFFSQSSTYPRPNSAAEAFRVALADAEVTADDLDFVQLYDCFTIAVLLQIEELGLCERGRGGDYLRRPTTGENARLAINTHGGSLSQAYLLGINHYTEAVRQIRGEAGSGQLATADLGLVGVAPHHDYAAMVLGAKV